MLSLTLCLLILAHVPLHRRNDLCSLLFTSKAFHDAAEPLVYHHIIFTDVHRIRLFINSLSNAPRLARLVHTFGINLSDLRARARIHPHEALHVQVVLRREFWEAVRDVLSAMPALENLVLIQIPALRMNFTWILDSDNHPLPFSLREIKLQLTFDNHVARFLNTQSAKGKLYSAQIYNVSVPRISDALLSLNPASAATTEVGSMDGIEDVRLQDVNTLDISLSLTPHIIDTSSSSLEHLRILIDIPTDDLPISTLVDTLTHLLSPSPHSVATHHRRGLRGLSIVDIPASLSTPLLTHILHPPSPSPLNLSSSTSSPSLAQLASTLTHLSHLHYPKPYPSNSPDRQEFLNALISFHSLRSIELSLTSWELTDSKRSNSGQLNQLGLGYNGGGNSGIPSPAAQKALITELKIYCPTLRVIILWIGKMRFRWAYVEEDYYDPPLEVLYSGQRPVWEEGGEAGFDIDVAVGRGGGGGGREGKGGVRSSELTSSARDCGAASFIQQVPPRLENAVVPGEWNHRMDMNSWPGYSNLWSSC